jgi:hypothetical protein
MAMIDQLTRFSPRAPEPHPVNHVVEAAFQQLQQVLPGHSLAPVGLFKVAAKLALQDPVDPFGLLLLPQLLTVLGKFLAGLPVLSRRVTFPGHTAFISVTAITFQVEFISFAAA